MAVGHHTLGSGTHRLPLHWGDRLGAGLHRRVLPEVGILNDEWTKRDHNHYGPYPGGKPENFKHTKAKPTKHAPGDRYVKRDTRALKQAVQEKYNYRCARCHKWFSKQQRNNHGCPP